MHISSVPKSIKGFTLIESSITIVIFGILASITAPSLLTWYNNKQVEQGLQKIKGALVEAQRQAIRQSRDCVVTIASGTDATITASPTSCLSTDLASTRTLTGLTARQSASTFTFDYKGETANTTETMVVSMSGGGSIRQKCLVKSGPLGLMRTGTYLSTDTTGTAEANCQ
jgi:prepilin-type N-terminal cleavage/methylation domain-containing protein